MKHILYLLLALLTISAASCKKDEPNPIPVPEGIDLGTVDADGKPLLWASFNLGAGKEYEYGNCYAWGETMKKSTYSWDNYVHASGSANKLIKYCPMTELGLSYWDISAKSSGQDGNIELLPADDVAHKLLGGNWRMPTSDEINALLALKQEAQKSGSNYIWEEGVSYKDAEGNEVKDSKGNTVCGIRISRKSNGATLFLPAAGFVDQDGVLKCAAEYGTYWSSSLDVNAPPKASYLYFTATSASCRSENRFFGFTIRPVCTK